MKQHDDNGAVDCLGYLLKNKSHTHFKFIKLIKIISRSF